LGIDGLAASPSDAPTKAIVGNYYGYKFTVGDYGYVRSFEVPYDWDSTTDLEVKVHWYSNNASASKFIDWQIDYNATAENTEQVNAATATITTGDIPVSVTAYRLTETSVFITSAAVAADDVLGMKITRIAASGGAGVIPDDEPVIIGMELEYTADKLGEAI
jgi:hypothetical protein